MKGKRISTRDMVDQKPIKSPKSEHQTTGQRTNTRAASAKVTKRDLKTHVHLQRRGISDLKQEGVQNFLQARVVFLQHNLLQRTDFLQQLAYLQELYLQHNCIRRLTGLRTLRRLRVLVVSHNSLSVVEGLPPSLTALHLAHQTPPQGDTLLLDPLHVSVPAATLTELNISGNALEEVRALRELPNLVELDCGDNALSDLNDVCLVLNSLKQLRVLVLRGNPLYGNTAYWTKVTSAAGALEELDGRCISAYSRLCLARRALSARKARRDQPADEGAEGGTGERLPRTEADQPHPGNQHIFFTAEDRSSSARPFGMYPSAAVPLRVTKKSSLGDRPHTAHHSCKPAS